MDYSYMAEKFASARSSLMLPHPSGIAESVSWAMWNCMHALQEVKGERPAGLEPHLGRLIELMETSGLQDPDGIGLHIVKARMFTEDDLDGLSKSVDALATLCARERDGFEIPPFVR